MTAEQIGRSSKLIKPDFEVFRMKDRESVLELCSEAFVKKNEEMMKSKIRRALIVESTALTYITERSNLEMNFI
jgi:phage-related minor tail protein